MTLLDYRPQRLDRVLVDHGADVDAEHTLGDDACAPRHRRRSQRRQREHDADGECREQGRRRYADEGERHRRRDRHRRGQGPPKHQPGPQNSTSEPGYYQDLPFKFPCLIHIHRDITKV